MSDNFFGFDTNFPSRNILGGKGLDEELLTDDVEEEYDALNDETFGRAANDDWEEAHEKLSELIIRKDVGKNSIFDDSLLETDESQNEIVSKSISQLGLEDDLDDPAIMTIARSCHRISHMRPYRSSSSPPPPAILETEFCGSPKTHSIWSTTPKDSGVSSIFQSLSHRSGSPCLDQSALLNTSSDSVFSTPPKAWHAEDLEKDLLSSSNKDHNTSIHNSSWPQAPHLNRNNNNQNVSPKLAGFSNNLGQNQNKIVMDQMLTREEVERQMHSESRLHFPPGVNTAPSPKLPWMGRMPPNLMPPMGPRGNLNSPNQSPVVPMRPPLGPLMRNGATERFFVNSRINNMMHNQMPVRGPVMPNLPPGFNPSNMNMNHKLMFLPPRSIAHPFLHKQFQFPMVVHNSYYGNEESRNAYQNSEDEYAGLMTQKEKDWLIRIQMLTLKSENPYVEDYYFTTQVARRCRKKYSEEKNSGNSKASGDAPDLILPETKHESRAFVPVQFEGSLGKLQAVSVNFPRKVLDVGVKRSLEDEEGKVVTNQSLMRYRRLLQDIEKLYNNFLEIEDEERRILAKPEGEGSSHRENIARLTKDIYTGLINESSEDYFQNLMTVRKGRSLYFRVFKLFSLDQQLQCLVSLLRCLHVVLKRDQNDLILVQNVRMILDAVQQLPFQHLVLLGETLENDASSDPVKGKEKSNLVAAFKSKFGTSVICTILMQAETLYPSLLQNESDLQSRWTKVILHLVDCLCSLPNSSIAPCEISSSKLLNHFERFAVDRDKFNLLKERVSQFQSNLPPKIEMKEV